jgi:trigger factor
MEIEVKELEYCKVNVHYEIELDDALEIKRNQIAEKMKHKKVPGFRAGKVPLDILKQVFKEQIKDETANELASEAVQNTIVEKNLRPFGNPQFSSYSMNGNKFVCDFSMFIQPEFDLKQYKEFEIPKPKQAVKPDELAQKTLQEIRSTNGTERQFDENDAIAMGDNAVIKYSCIIDGEKADRLCADNELVRVGQTPIPQFDEGLVGMRVGEEKTFTIVLPADVDDSFAGKEATFTTSVILGSKISPAALDDDLAKKVGLKTLQELMAAVQAMASNRAKELENAAVVNQITARLVAEHDFKIPLWLSLAESKYKAANEGHNWDDLEDFRKEQIIKQSERSIRLTLVLNKVRENEPMATLTEEETISAIRQGLVKQVKNIDEAMQTIYKNGQLPMLANKVKDDFAVDFIRGTCKIVE